MPMSSAESMTEDLELRTPTMEGAVAGYSKESQSSGAIGMGATDDAGAVFQSNDVKAGLEKGT